MFRLTTFGILISGGPAGCGGFKDAIKGEVDEPLQNVPT
jgi:hypothetical protein